MCMRMCDRCLPRSSSQPSSRRTQVGLDIELRNPNIQFNGLRYRGHDVYFAQPEDVDGRGRVLRIAGWYSTDNPAML